MDKFEIVPYETQHGKDMIAFGLNDKLMDYDATFEENRIDFALPGLSFTLLCNSEPSAVVALFLYGMELLKAGLSQAKEYIKTELNQQD